MKIETVVISYLVSKVIIVAIGAWLVIEGNTIFGTVICLLGLMGANFSSSTEKEPK